MHIVYYKTVIDKMGNDVSRLSGLEINEKAIQVCDFWAHYHASVNEKSLHFGLKTSGIISVFKGDTAVLGPLWSTYSPLEKCSNNLLKYRHPSILRYISSWRQHSNILLATELVHPLAHLLPSQVSLQICVGLNSILQALVFLHDTAKLSHNNICIHSIYVTLDGSWKLGGMEYSKPFLEMNTTYLKQAKSYRYEKGVDPDEDSHNNISKVDQYAFGTLVDEVFASRNDDEVPCLSEFKQYCHTYLQNADVSLRPNLRTVLQHNFFNHDFVAVHNFLTNLPLKSESEKAELFENLLDTLHKFNEETVASQLGCLLLSRLVLLDSTAREKVLPQLLRPQNETSTTSEKCGFFTLSVFKKYITPKLLHVFCVRDAQIRMLLLLHFRNFIRTFSNEELNEHILPELLLGIKDTDDNLVAMTLRCLADLVSVLGAATVIGGKRAKIFSDGRPMQHLTTKQQTKSKLFSRQNSCNTKNESLPFGESSLDHHSKINFKSVVEFPCSEDASQYSGDSLHIENSVHLQERPSPDGGEDETVETNNIDVDNLKSNSDDNWSDWNESEKLVPSINVLNDPKIDGPSNSNDLAMDTIVLDDKSSDLDKVTQSSLKLDSSQKQEYMHKAAIEAKMKKMTDISELDIKNQTNVPRRTKGSKDEFDFFADMEPVIERPSTLNVAVESSEESASSTNNATNKFQFVPVDDVELDEAAKSSAWDDDDWT